MSDKVLVVDDDKTILTMLFKALKNNGIEADLAISGEAALELVKQNKYDLILLDITETKKQRPEYPCHGCQRQKRRSGRSLRSGDRCR